MGVWGWVRVWALVLLCVAVLAGWEERAISEVAPFQPQQTVAAELVSLAARSSAVFVGQITGIERHGGVVEVTFHVDQPIAGNVADAFVLREWAGQWPLNQMRYIPGLRALVFAEPPSSAGFSSPVDGAVGLVPVVVQGADAPMLLNIQRLAATIQRMPGTPLPTGRDTLVSLTDALAWIADAGALPGRLPQLPHNGGMPAPWLPVQGATTPETARPADQEMLHRAEGTDLEVVRAVQE